MGIVSTAFDRQLRREVAVKVLRPELLGEALTREQFTEEAVVLAGLDHPGAVPVYETGTLEDGSPFCAMKKVRGVTLRDVLFERNADSLASREDLAHLVDVFERVCQTVAAAHDRGIVHRDLKPDNVMVDDLGAVYVMDWGLAYSVHSAGERLSRLRAGAGRDRRDAGLHGARAGPGAGARDRAPQRRLRPRDDPLRDPHGKEPVPRGDRAGSPEGGAGARSASGRAREPESRPGALRGLPEGDVEGRPRSATRRPGSSPTRSGGTGSSAPWRRRRPPSLERVANWARRRPAVAASLVTLLAALLLVGVARGYRAFTAAPARREGARRSSRPRPPKSVEIDARLVDARRAAASAPTGPGGDDAARAGRRARRAAGREEGPGADLRARRPRLHARSPRPARPGDLPARAARRDRRGAPGRPSDAGRGDGRGGDRGGRPPERPGLDRGGRGVVRGPPRRGARPRTRSADPPSGRFRSSSAGSSSASFAHASRSVWATARTTGPTKIPIRPNVIRPPRTPAKTRTSGRSAPFLIRIGRRTLSIVPTTIVQTRRNTPQPVWPLQKR